MENSLETLQISGISFTKCQCKICVKLLGLGLKHTETLHGQTDFISKWSFWTLDPQDVIIGKSMYILENKFMYSIISYSVR